MDVRGHFISGRKSSWRGLCRNLPKIKSLSVCAASEKWNLICSFWNFFFVSYILLGNKFKYRCTSCLRRNRGLVERLNRLNINAKELNFPTKYSQSKMDQFLACLWKQNLCYWRNPQYSAVRFFYTVIISLMLGTICWRFGSKRCFLHKPSLIFVINIANKAAFLNFLLVALCDHIIYLFS